MSGKKKTKKQEETTSEEEGQSSEEESEEQSSNESEEGEEESNSSEEEADKTPPPKKKADTEKKPVSKTKNSTSTTTTTSSEKKSSGNKAKAKGSGKTENNHKHSEEDEDENALEQAESRLREKEAQLESAKKSETPKKKTRAAPPSPKKKDPASVRKKEPSSPNKKESPSPKKKESTSTPKKEASPRSGKDTGSAKKKENLATSSPGRAEKGTASAKKQVSEEKITAKSSGSVKTKKTTGSGRQRSATADTSGVGKLERKEISEKKSPKKSPKKPSRDDAAPSSRDSKEDEFDDQILAVFTAVHITTQKSILKKIPNAFAGKDALDVLQAREKGARHDSFVIMQEMLERGVIVEANPRKKSKKEDKKEYADLPKVYYRFNLPTIPPLAGKEKEITLEKTKLNHCKEWKDKARNPEDVIESLFNDIKNAYTKYSSKHSVDWAKLKSSKELTQFHLRACELQKVKLSSFVDKEQKRAFFINLYNVLVLHSHATLGSPPDNLIRRKWVTDYCFYIVDGLLFSSSLIESNILRGEKMEDLDERKKHAVELKDPFHLMALCDGTQTTLPFAFYPLAPKSFDKVWKAHVAAFLNATVQVETDSITLPFLLTRYKEIGSEDHAEVVLQRVVPFLDKELADKVRLALKMKTDVKYDKMDRAVSYVFAK